MQARRFFRFFHRRSRRGSALIVVLGMLSVLLVMAVAFSTFTRTERSSSTNVKNAQVARAALQSALARVIDAIDTSFDSPTNNWPVACWPEPFLSSSKTDSFGAQSKARSSNSDFAEANILTYEMSKSLTPEQLALVRTAKCDWVPLKASINASGKGGDGRPSGDSIVGRFAFVALETTGLLDANIVGMRENERADTPGTDPYAFQLPESGDISSAVLFNGSGNPVSRSSVSLSLKNPSGFRSTRENEGPFLSISDVRNLCDSSTFDLDPPDKASNYFPANLFTTFSPSLEELDPNGHPKVALPSDGFSSGAELNRFAARSLRAMVEVFARSRKDSGQNPGDADRDVYTFFEKSSSPLRVSRARLATVAMLDAMDDDIIPGHGKNGLMDYWPTLPDLPSSGNDAVSAFGTTIRDEAPPQKFSRGTTGRLNFPSTDTIPMVSRAFAYVDITNAVPTLVSPYDSYVTYQGCVRFGVLAVNMNWSTNDIAKSCRMDVLFDVLGGNPQTRSVSTPSGNVIEKGLNYGLDDVTWTFHGNETTVAGALASASATREGVVHGGSATLPPGRCLLAEGSIPVTIKAHADVVSSGGESGGGGGSGRPGSGGSSGGGSGGSSGGGSGRPGGGGSSGGTTPYTAKAKPLSENIPWIPVRLAVRVSVEGEEVQRVPAPALDHSTWGSTSGRSYWIRMDMGVPDNSGACGVSSASPNSVFPMAGNTVNTSRPANLSSGLPASLGWAFCLAPAFAFDTTSLYCDLENDPITPLKTGFWLNDLVAEKTDVPAWKAFAKEVEPAADENPSSIVDQQFRGPIGHTQSGLSLYFYQKFLFNVSQYGNSYSEYVCPGIRAVPDLLHGLSSADTANKEIFGTRLGNGYIQDDLVMDFYTHIDNGPMESAGDIGRVMCGPWETLSLFQTYRYPASSESDFHRVMDYFTTGENRYPTSRDINDATDPNTGRIKYGSNDLRQSPLYSEVHAGRVNLNAPYLVRLVSDKVKTLVTNEDEVPNPFPLIAALKGASCSSFQTSRTLSGRAAGAIAASFLSGAHTTVHSERWNHSRDMVFTVAELGAADSDDKKNYTLETVIQESAPQSDADRESFLRNAANAVTTRGQSFLVIIRADAYSPMYGHELETGDGNTLASTHAIVELWRDPEPARYADGSLPQDANGNPVAFHNWYVRSFRVF